MSVSTMQSSTLLLSAVVVMVTGMPTKDTEAAAKDDGDIYLDLERLSKLGEPDKYLTSLRQLAQALHGCGVKEVPDLRRHFLKNKTVTCNDGSPAGYYLRKMHGVKKWVVFLEGGWYCFDRQSCHGRWLNEKHLMSSRNWPPTKKGAGILSWDPEENPYLFTANMVFIPYCSSDSWSGTAQAKSKGDFSFMGALIVEEVLKDLLPHGLSSGKKLILAGSSAGGTGVLINLDRISRMMASANPKLEVRGVADSGWFLDNSQYKQKPCSDAHTCAPTEGIKRGIKLWKGLVPDDCKAQYAESEQWRCYFGYRIYPTMKTPVFIVQHLFDEAQVTVDNVGAPVTKQQWAYIHNMGGDMKNTLTNVSGVFASACLSHIMLTRSEWYKISIRGVTLPKALRCWEEGTEERNHYVSRHQRHSVNLPHKLITSGIQGDHPNQNQHRKHRKKKRKCARKKSRRRKHKKDRNNQRSSVGKTRGRNRRPKRSLVFDLHERHHMQHHSNKCQHHLLDTCGWPQCNLSCPKIRNPFTGDEMDFIDLLMQFGLDLSSIADALNIDLTTLQTMDHDVLLRLLTQQKG